MAHNLYRAGKEASSAPASAGAASEQAAAEAAAQQAAAQQAAEQPDSKAAPATGAEDDDEDDENETCGFCRFMKGGGCRSAFVVSGWLQGAGLLAGHAARGGSPLCSV